MMPRLKPKLMCVICGMHFGRRSIFYHHILLHRKRSKVSFHDCVLCEDSFPSKLLREYHLNSQHRCCYCDYEESNVRKVLSHRRNCHQRFSSIQSGGRGAKKFSPYPFKAVEAFQGYLQTFRQRKKRWNTRIISIVDYFIFYSDKINDILSHVLNQLKSIKMQFSVVVQFVRKQTADSEEEKCVHYVNTNQRVLLNMFYYRKVMSEIIDQCVNTVTVFEQNGSGWILDEVIGCDLKIARFETLGGGCFLPIPNCFRYARTIINPQNTGTDCFKWAFLAVQHYKDVQGSHRERVTQYKRFENLYDFTKMSFPATLKDISKFEKSNSSKGFRINVFGMYYAGDEQYNVHVMYLSRFNNDKTRNILNLLYAEDSAQNHAHYMSIVDINKLLGQSNHHKHFLCYNCLQRSTSLKNLEEHESLCLSFKSQRLLYPCETRFGDVPKLCFTKYQNKLKTQFVIYADFESILIPENRSVGQQTVYQRHSPSGFSIIAINNFQEVVDKLVYRGENCVDVFFQKINSLCLKFVSLNKNYVPMVPLTDEESLDYAIADTCHICDSELKNNCKTRDHCHITGKFRGAAHRFCNANFAQNPRIPIVLHNFKNYDQHLLISGIKQNGFKGVKTIPQNTEKFLSIICETYVFIDSMMFLAAGLDDLVKNLSCDVKSDAEFEKRFSILVQFFGLSLAKRLSRKGVFPYEYINSFSRFEEKVFPPHDEFYSSITNSLISKDDYNYGKTVFKDLCTNLGDYHDLYMTVDTLLLACVFENFREIALSNYKLDPCRYFSLAGYAWDSALLNTKQELELITDSEMYNVIESGLRGGVSMISTRYATAFNKYMPKYKKGEQEDRFLLYIDKNNLYGEALMQYLPVSDFQWANQQFIESFTEDVLLQMDDNCSQGYILMVDLAYPDELHEEHDEYPLMPEKMSVAKEKLSPYQTALAIHLGIKYSEKSTKLIPHLGERHKYVVHYRNLKYYVSKGVKITKVHKILTFTQEPWLRDYVLLNARLRREAKSEFEKSFFKFMVNSIFGKSMEQKRNRMEAVIVSNQYTLNRYIRKSTFKSYQIIDDKIAIVFMNRPQILLDSPIYTAFTVLDISKLLMYEWHYDKIKVWYGDKAVFLFTDTDSLAYCIYTEDLFEDLKSKSDEFDFSDYPKDHPLYSDVNKKVIGKMKDEANSQILTGFAGLAPKMYSFCGLNKLSKKAAKGVKKTIIKQKLRHSTYVRTLKNQKKLYCIMNLIRSRKHRMETTSVKKVALHCFDSKRYILKDGTTTLSLNSCNIPV